MCFVNLRINLLKQLTKLLIFFLEIFSDDLKQVKSDITNMSEKLETLKLSETGDKGQFQKTNS